MPDPNVSPAAAAPVRRKILVRAGGLPMGFIDPRFDAVLDEELAAVVADYDMVIPADHLRDPPLGGGSLRLAFLCHEIDSYLRVAALDPPGDLLLCPSPVAALDMLRRGRLTLVAARALPAGHILNAADLDEEVGGPGLGGDLRPALIGRRLLYPLTAGQAIDFGYISEDFEEPAP